MNFVKEGDILFPAVQLIYVLDESYRMFNISQKKWMLF